MTTIMDIGWGSYKQYEGPFFRGSSKFVLSDDPTDNEKVLAVITSTEGGAFDAINMYDRCVLSSGLIQWCEAGQFSVSDMLGAVVEATRNIPPPLQSVLTNIGVDFKKNDRGRWRFFFRDSRAEVDRLEEQQQLFLLRSNGTRGSWDNASKEYAKSWAAAIATVFQDPLAQKVQMDFTVPKLMGFVTPQAKEILFGEELAIGSIHPGDWRGAGRAAYLSFAANLPSVASKSVQEYVEDAGVCRWTKSWTIGLLKALTFDPNIAIYPARYNAIRPTLESLYDVDLPDFADELKQQQDQTPNVPVTELNSVQEIQAALIKLGFDLGPLGADGKYGPKTRDAIITFQSTHGLQADGIVGPKTKTALYTAISV